MHVAVKGAVSYAQAETGYVQSRAGPSPDCERSNGLATQLSVLLGPDRTLSVGLSASASLSCHAPLSRVRTARPLHRRRRVAIAQRRRTWSVTTPWVLGTEPARRLEAHRLTVLGARAPLSTARPFNAPLFRSIRREGTGCGRVVHKTCPALAESHRRTVPAVETAGGRACTARTLHQRRIENTVPRGTRQWHVSRAP